MSHRVEYVSQRGEIWIWYWQIWWRSLWKVHLAVFLVVASIVFVFRGGIAHPAPAIYIAIVCGLLPVAVLVLLPQFFFSPQPRTFSMDSDGIETVINTRLTKMAWDEIGAVVTDAGYVVFVSKTGGALIIPPRAFESPVNRGAFLAFAQRAVQASNP